VTWDDETERRVDEALEVVASGGRMRFDDYHPWAAPPGRVSASGAGLRAVARTALEWAVVGALVVALTGAAARSTGAGHVLWAALACVVLAASAVLVL
jgi:hypothetical protein